MPFRCWGQVLCHLQVHVDISFLTMPAEGAILNFFQFALSLWVRLEEVQQGQVITRCPLPSAPLGPRQTDGSTSDTAEPSRSVLDQIPLVAVAPDLMEAHGRRGCFWQQW